MSDREEFEKAFPVPANVYWDENRGLYDERERDWDAREDDYQNAAFDGWQAARATPALIQSCMCDREITTGWTSENGVPLCNVCGKVDVSAAFEMSKEPPALPYQPDEIPRLVECLKKANEQAEHFERQYYLLCDKVEELESRAPALPQGVEEWMPILGTCLAIPMKLLDESQAKSNHGQTPARLKERGGISLSEAVAIAGKMKWRSLESKRALEILHDLSGMAIVPVEPTRAMCKAATSYTHSHDAMLIYKAMLAAAKEKGE